MGNKPNLLSTTLHAVVGSLQLELHMSSLGIAQVRGLGREVRRRARSRNEAREAKSEWTMGKLWNCLVIELIV